MWQRRPRRGWRSPGLVRGLSLARRCRAGRGPWRGKVPPAVRGRPLSRAVGARRPWLSPLSLELARGGGRGRRGACGPAQGSSAKGSNKPPEVLFGRPRREGRREAALSPRERDLRNRGPEGTTRSTGARYLVVGSRRPSNTPWPPLSSGPPHGGPFAPGDLAFVRECPGR